MIVEAAMKKIILPVALCLISIVTPAFLRGQDKSLIDAWDRLPKAERWFQNGLKEFQSGRSGAAAKDFEKCLREIPRHAYALYYLANIDYIANDMPKALAGMKRAVEDLDFMQALNDYALRQKSKTYASYERMIAEEWEATTSCRSRRELESIYGAVTDEKGRQEIQLARQKASRSRQKAHYFYFLGNIQFQLRDFSEAARSYEEAISLNPRHVSAYNNLAAIFYLAGDPGRALGYLDEAERQELGDYLNLTLKHMVFEALGRPTAGILQEEISAGLAGDLGVTRFALAFKSKDPLRPSLYENGYVVFSRSTHEAVLIDPGAEDPRIDEFVRAQALRIRAILYTHGHDDHASAGRSYASLYRAPILLKAEDARGIAAAPDRTFSDGETLSYDGFALKVIHIAGHTPGSVCFLVGDVLISGDTLFKNGIGLVSAENPAKTAKIQEAMVRNIRDKLLTLPDETRVCPGHGKTSTIAGEKADNPFLKR